MSDDQDHPRGGDAGTERALDELRVALEQLAARMGAGFREDLAQIRAIAASVAERDLTADVEALRVDVATLVGRDSSTELRDEVAALRTDLARVASSDDVTTGLGSRLAPLQSAVDRISSRLDDDTGQAQVLTRFEALEARLDQLAGDDASTEVLARLDALTARLDSLPTSQQVANLSGDLRAHLADALADFDGDAVMREIAGVRSQLGGGHGSLLEDLQDNLADVASGEVVGALWDEVLQLRTDFRDLVVVPEPVAPATPEPDPQLAALTDELAVLRTELAEGLVVEPSDALSSSLDALKAEVDGLRDGLGDLRAALAPVAAPPVDDDRDERLLEQLGAIRVGLDEVHTRLDDGLVLADGDDETSDESGGSVIEAVAEQVAALRGFVSAELDTVRQAVSARLDAAAEDAAAAAAVPPVDDGRDEQLLEQLVAIRVGLDEVRSRLESSVAAEETSGRADILAAAIDASADQMAALRGFVSAELDTVRQAVSARLDAAAEDAAAAAAVPPVDDGRDDQFLEQLGAIRVGLDEVRSRLDEIPVSDDDETADGGDDAVIEAVAEQVAALRGFVSAELDTVRQAVSARLDAAAEEQAAALAVPPVDDGRDEQLLEQLGAIRVGLDEVRSRLDEVPVSADDAELAPLEGEAPDAADVEAIADQVAALRDFLATELDTVRQTMSSRFDAAAEATAATVAQIVARPEPAPAPGKAPATEGTATLDPDTIDVLRDEIRASGGVADQVVDALREELKALRRRIAVKAAERVLDDQQLAQIADAVAARLAEDREQG